MGRNEDLKEDQIDLIVFFETNRLPAHENNWNYFDYYRCHGYYGFWNLGLSRF